MCKRKAHPRPPRCKDRQSASVFLPIKKSRRGKPRKQTVLGLPFPVHPHMLRHACGFYLANKGVDTRSIQHYLGHRNIQHTVRYTELAPHRFDGFWDD